jgi:trans-aconitate methyltransferase
VNTGIAVGTDIRPHEVEGCPMSWTPLAASRQWRLRRRTRGLALGVDISEPMLARAVSAEAGPQIGFLRADAQRLPLRDETVDAVVSVAVLQLIPDRWPRWERWRGCCDRADDWP